MNVKELMATSLLKKAAVIAGHEGLLRDITWCAPDTAIRFENWLMPGLLLIFTGKHEKYGWDAYMDMLIARQPAAVLVFDAWNQEKIFPEKYNPSSFDAAKIPLILLQKASNPLAFTKQVGAMLSGEFNNDRRVEEWLRDICYSKEVIFDEILAHSLGYASGYPYYCILAELRKSEHKNPLFIEMDMNYAKSLLTETFQRAQIGSLPVPLSFINDNTLIYFAPLPMSATKNNKNNELITSAVLRLKQQMPHCKWSFSVGIPANDLREFSESFHTAQQTAHTIHILRVHETVSFYENWYMHMLLLQEPPAKLHQYMERTLSPILDNVELLDTLCDYLTFGENLKLTAEHMHIHTNTIKYRLQKISSILNCDLGDPNVRFRLRMVITIYRYLYNEENS